MHFAPHLSRFRLNSALTPLCWNTHFALFRTPNGSKPKPSKSQQNFTKVSCSSSDVISCASFTSESIFVHQIVLTGFQTPVHQISDISLIWNPIELKPKPLESLRDYLKLSFFEIRRIPCAPNSDVAFGACLVRRILEFWLADTCSLFWPYLSHLDSD